MKRKNSEWNAILRAWSILRRLMRTPASAGELMAAVEETVGVDAYPTAEKARLAAFKHDREKLRTRLQASFFYDPIMRVYRLEDPGPFGRLLISDQSLQALRLLTRSFSGSLGEKAQVNHLIEELAILLPLSDRRRLEQDDSIMVVDLKSHIDKGEISPRIWETLERAVNQQRKLSFQYQSPRYPMQQPVYHEIAPREIRYQEGHWYLRGWSLLRRTSDCEESRDSGYLRFRLTYILEDEFLRVWPSLTPTHYRQIPHYRVHYILLPPVGRGEISHHFPEMKIQRKEDGHTEILAVCEDIWEAARLLLGYGEACLVLGGEELRREMNRRVTQMARNYGLLD